MATILTCMQHRLRTPCCHSSGGSRVLRPFPGIWQSVFSWGGGGGGEIEGRRREKRRREGEEEDGGRGEVDEERIRKEGDR